MEGNARKMFRKNKFFLLSDKHEKKVSLNWQVFQPKYWSSPDLRSRYENVGKKTSMDAFSTYLFLIPHFNQFIYSAKFSLIKIKKRVTFRI